MGSCVSIAYDIRQATLFFPPPGQLESLTVTVTLN